MKKYSFLLILAIFLLSGCKKVKESLDQFTKFNLEFDENFTYPPAPFVSDSIPFDGPPVATNSDSTLKSNNSQRDLVQEVNLKKLQISITNPDSASFSFMNYIRVYIRADLNGDGTIDDATEKVEVANKLNIPSSIGAVLDLDPIPGDYKNYITQKEISLSILYGTNKPTTVPLDLYILSVFRVNAKILGV